MDIVVQPLSLVSIISILLIIIALILAFYKKYSIIYAIIIINFIVFMISFAFPNVVEELAFRPIYLTVEQFPQVYTLFTSMFLHGDLLHIFFNMFMFLLIATSFEDRIGTKKFLGIYLLTGVCAAIFHVLLSPLIPENTFMPFFSDAGLIGASGAISGILGAYAVSYPRDRVFFPIFIIIRMPVLIAGILFLSVQTMFAFMDRGSNIAYLAHIGGFISGIIIAAIFIRNKGPGLYEPIEKRQYDSFTPQKRSKIDMKKLRKFATTRELNEMLDKIENENVPQVRDIWLEHFFEKAVCPKCGDDLNHFENRVWCEKCGFKTNY